MRTRFAIAMRLFLAACPWRRRKWNRTKPFRRAMRWRGAAPKKVIVDNVNGSIHVTGYRAARSA